MKSEQSERKKWRDLGNAGGGEDLGNAVGEVVSIYRLCLSTPVG